MEVHPEQKSLKIARLLFTALIVLGFAAAIYFRFANLRLYPGWYSDEGNQIDLAENWMQGKWQNYGVIGAPYSQRPPLYMYTISAAMRSFWRGYQCFSWSKRRRESDLPGIGQLDRLESHRPQGRHSYTLGGCHGTLDRHFRTPGIDI